MLVVADTVLVDGIRAWINYKLELCKEAIESECFNQLELNRIYRGKR